MPRLAATSSPVFGAPVFGAPVFGALALGALALVAGACRSSAGGAAGGSATTAGGRATSGTAVGSPAGARSVRPPTCPAERVAPPVLPFAREIHAVARFWLARADDNDAVLLDGAAIAAHNRRMRGLRHEGYPAGRWGVLERPLDQARLDAHFKKQLADMHKDIRERKLMHADGRPPHALARRLGRLLGETTRVDKLAVAHRGASMRCLPSDQGLYDEPWQRAFDQLQCSRLRPGEAVRVLRELPSWRYVRTNYGEGWVRPRALTPAVTREALRRYLAPKRSIVVTRDRRALLDAAGSPVGVLRLGARVPLLARESKRWVVLAPTAKGLRRLRLDAGRGVRVGFSQLTRRALWRRAFSHLDAPYGWGGTGGHRDCSRMLMDLFDTFGLRVPRNSRMQQHAGSERVDVGKLSDKAKAAAIEAAGRRGLVLLYMPGHIMLYLGRDGQHLYALHQFSGYLVPCPGRRGAPAKQRETMLRVNRTAVTSLELGRGSTRRSFLERITKLVVFGALKAKP